MLPVFLKIQIFLNIQEFFKKLPFMHMVSYNLFEMLLYNQKRYWADVPLAV